MSVGPNLPSASINSSFCGDPSLGYLKHVLDPFEKQEAVALIEDYRQNLVPLVVPITLLRYHVYKHKITYLMGQLYLEPHPRELMFRNHV